MPVRLDSYKGCSFGCLYCYARSQESKRTKEKILPADPNALSNIFKQIDREDDIGRLSITSQFVKRRVPLHFGTMTDPFQPVERKFRVTQAYLEALAERNYPVVISTRSDMICEEPYLSLLKAIGNVIVRFSLMTVSDRLSRILEPQDVSPSKVLKAAQKIGCEGIKTAVRWQPYNPFLGQDIEQFIDTTSSIGISQLSFEFLKLPAEKRQAARISEEWKKAKNTDLYEIYRSRKPMFQVREFLLPKDDRIETILKVRDLVRKQGIAFGSADNDFQHLSSQSGCCSGIDGFEGFENWYKYQIAHAIKESVNSHEITFSAIANEWRPRGSINRYLNSKSRIATESGLIGNVTDHLRKRWNSNVEASPTYFYGVDATNKLDDNGNLIFKWNTRMKDKILS